MLQDLQQETNEIKEEVKHLKTSNLRQEVSKTKMVYILKSQFLLINNFLLQ